MLSINELKAFNDYFKRFENAAAEATPDASRTPKTGEEITEILHSCLTSTISTAPEADIVELALKNIIEREKAAISRSSEVVPDAIRRHTLNIEIAKGRSASLKVQRDQIVNLGELRQVGVQLAQEKSKNAELTRNLEVSQDRKKSEKQKLDQQTTIIGQLQKELEQANLAKDLIPTLGPDEERINKQELLRLRSLETQNSILNSQITQLRSEKGKLVPPRGWVGDGEQLPTLLPSPPPDPVPTPGPLPPLAKDSIQAASKSPLPPSPTTAPSSTSVPATAKTAPTPPPLSMTASTPPGFDWDAFKKQASEEPWVRKNLRWRPFTKTDWSFNPFKHLTFQNWNSGDRGDEFVLASKSLFSRQIDQIECKRDPSTSSISFSCNSASGYGSSSDKGYAREKTVDLAIKVAKSGKGGGKVTINDGTIDDIIYAYEKCKETGVTLELGPKAKKDLQAAKDGKFSDIGYSFVSEGYVKETRRSIEEILKYEQTSKQPPPGALSFGVVSSQLSKLGANGSTNVPSSSSTPPLASTTGTGLAGATSSFPLPPPNGAVAPPSAGVGQQHTPHL